MAITWILVANASIAKLYANLGPNKGLQLVKELMHPESRQKNADLVTDKPGSLANAASGKGHCEPQTTAKEYHAQRFAQELAHTLYQGRAANAFRRAIVCAPPSFMGLLNNCLDNSTNQLVSDRFDKDYTKTPEPELRSHLAGCIFL